METSGLDSIEFLRDYWQQKALVIRGAIPAFSDPIEPEELAGLACEKPVESRLVYTEGKHWRMVPGPFSEDDFTTLPEQGWTLMVQSVDHWVPELASLFDLVSFLPTWRRDDLMVSYATTGAGVGPHFDFYDVFILQGQGTRTWKLGQKCGPDSPLDTSSGMKILEDFTTLETVVLEAGDLLYIPPGIAHWGESLDNSLSYSLGFRAPSAADMLIGISDELADMLDDHRRYQDDSSTLTGGACIPPRAIEGLTSKLCALLQDNPEASARWFGSVMTSPRHENEIIPIDRPYTSEETSMLMASSLLVRNSFSRIAWTPATGVQGRLMVFYDGEITTTEASPAAIALIDKVATLPPDTPLDMSEEAVKPALVELISALLCRGTLLMLEQAPG